MLNFSHMKDNTILKTIHKLKISIKPSFNSEIADEAENIRLKGQEK